MPHLDIPDEPSLPALVGPSRATVITWLRYNLGVTLFVGGLMSGVTTSLIAGVQIYDSFQASILALSQSVDGIPSQNVRGLRADMADVDRRFNTQIAMIAELRRARDLEIAAKDARDVARDADLDSRLRVLEAQLRFIAGRLGARS